MRSGEPARRAALDDDRLPRGFHALIATQFVSALADNALLIVAIALLQARGLPGWWAPLLKVGLTLSYVLLAPLVGALADARPKGRVMGWMNAVKALGAVLLLLGVHPVLAFAVVGLGAAAYAPAKYGLLTELVAPRQLVVANGWIEVSVVGAVLLGTVLGGVLISPAVLSSSPWQGLAGWFGPSAPPGGTLAVSVSAVLSVYALAAVMNIGVPAGGRPCARGRGDPLHLAAAFLQAHRRLWRDVDGGLSLSVTTIFWGVGATLQFAVLHWAAEALRLPLDQATRLQGVVAVGVVAGAAAAGRWVPLTAARRVLGAGVVLGLLMPVVAQVDEVAWAVPLLVLAGAVAGLMVVPLNALLQHRGVVLLGAGQSIAVQGFNENASVLLMLGAYAGLLALGLSSVVLMTGLGLVVAAAIGLLMWRDRRRT